MSSKGQNFGGGGGGGGGMPVIDGNGFLVHINGVFVTREVLPFGQALVENGDGRLGPLRIGHQPWIAKIERANGQTAGDQVLEVKNITTHMVEKFVFVNATSVPVEMTGGIYTNKNKTGEILVPASQIYTAMSDDPYASFVIDVTPKLRSVPFFYWNLTTLNGAPFECDIFAFGRVTEPTEMP